MTLRKTSQILLALVGTAIISSCANIPGQIRGEYAEISPARVQPDTFGTQVRWGGVLVDTHNEQDRTCFEVLSRELDQQMRPRTGDSTAGRFIACTNGFYDPEVYTKGREVTITAQINGIETRKIEAFDYRYPVLEISNLVLWEERKDEPYYSPYYYPYYWGYPFYGGSYGGYYSYHHFSRPYYGPGRSYGRGVYSRPSQIVTRER